MFLARRLIRKKRDGLELEDREIREFVRSLVRGEIPDYQIAAFLMAAFINGLTEAETVSLTMAMAESGRVISWPGSPGPCIDKHSTGGVGDKISLVLAPLMACCGLRVPMISGRSLGHTGGTLDKMESIPGYNAQIDHETLVRVVEEIGCVIAGQSRDMVPADRRLYALRDATETVESIPLITASIASKKLAEGIDGLVLDVKTGSGAFLPDIQQGVELALSIGRVIESQGKRFAALITDMDQPLGSAVGNALEVVEALDVLEGRGPDDVRRLSLALAAKALEIAGICDYQEGLQRAEKALDSGCPARKFRDMVIALGGRFDAIYTPDFTATGLKEQVKAGQGGYLQGFDNRAVGLAATALGAGRTRAEDSVDPKVGILVHAKKGELVEAGQPVFTVLANDETRMKSALGLLKSSFTVGSQPPEPTPLVLGVVQNNSFTPGNPL